MISLASDFTDRKGRQARGWLFYDAECDFCTRITHWLRQPMVRRGLDIAPLQDPRVSPLLGLSRDELLRAVRYLAPDGKRYAGADALLAVASEMWWARPLVWLVRIRAVRALIRVGYAWIARHRKCHAAVCVART